MSKHILTDESGRPVAVQIEYEEWLRIENILNKVDSETARDRIMGLAGTVKWDEDPVEYQRRLRDEWD